MHQVTKKSPVLATCISKNIKNVENAELLEIANEEIKNITI